MGFILDRVEEQNHIQFASMNLFSQVTSKPTGQRCGDLSKTGKNTATAKHHAIDSKRKTD